MVKIVYNSCCHKKRHSKRANVVIRHDVAYEVLFGVG